MAILVVPARFHGRDCLSADRHGGVSKMDLIGMLPGGSLDTFPLLSGEGGGLEDM